MASGGVMLMPMLPGRHLLAAALCAALSLNAAVVGAAPDDEATRLHRLGYERGKAGDFAGAIAAFKAAHKLRAKPVLICNVGLAYKHWGRLPQAELFLSRCDAEPPARRAASFRKYLAETRTKLAAGSFARLRITSKPAGATVRVSGFAPDETFQTPRTIWLAFGEHELRVSKDGYKPHVERVSLTQSGQREVVVELKRPPPPVKVEPRPEKPPPVRRIVADKQPVPPKPVRASRVPLVITAAGLALLAGGGVGHFFAARARDAASSADPTPPGAGNSEYEQNLQTFRSRRTIAVGLYAAGGVALAVGVYLYARNRGATRERPSVALTPFATPSSAGVSFVWMR